MEAMLQNQTSSDTAGQTSVNPESHTFEYLYCRQSNCSPGQFERKILWKCLHHPLMTPAVRMIFQFRSHVFSLDTNLISLVSKTNNFNDFRNTVQAFDGFDRLHPDNNFFRRTLHLRISRRKLITLARQVFDQAPQP